MEPLPSCDPEYPHSRPRVPLERGTASEEQESDIRDLPLLEMPVNQAVVLQRLLDWPRSHRSPVQELLRQLQIKMVERGLRPKPLLVSHNPQRLFPLVDQFLRLSQNLGTNPVGKTIGLRQLSLLGEPEARSQADLNSRNCPSPCARALGISSAVRCADTVLAPLSGFECGGRHRWSGSSVGSARLGIRSRFTASS